MSTDTMREKFEEYATTKTSMDLAKDSEGFYLDTYTIGFFNLFIQGYQARQRDLIEAMGEPVAWVRRHPDGGLTDRFIEHEAIEPVRKQSGAWVPLHRLPGDVQK